MPLVNTGIVQLKLIQNNIFTYYYINICKYSFGTEGLVAVKRQIIVYLAGVLERTKLSMKHLSDVIRMLLRRMVLIEAKTSAVSLGF